MKNRYFSLSALLLCLMLVSIPHDAQAQTTTPAFHLVITGPTEVVLNWQKDHCPSQGPNDNDEPDIPARALRDADGQVHLYANNHNNRQMIGSTLNDVKRVSCTSIMPSEYNPDPGAYGDFEWLHAFYTEDGKTVTALIHDEYHGWTVPGQCSKTTDSPATCWDASIIAATSTDGGNTFQQLPMPDRLIAASPYVYKKDIGRIGVHDPSNIIYVAAEKHYYFMALASPYMAQKNGVCLFRNDTLNPATWKAWDGQDFTVSFASPYAQPDLNPAEHVCEPVAPDDIAQMDMSLTYNTATQSYILVGNTTDKDATGKTVSGIYYSFSTDLLHWTHRQLLLAGPRPIVGDFAINAGMWQPGDSDPMLYGSFLDPDSPSRNFDVTGQTGYVYYTDFHTKDGKARPDRDLVRIPVKIVSGSS